MTEAGQRKHARLHHLVLPGSAAKAIRAKGSSRTSLRRSSRQTISLGQGMEMEFDHHDSTSPAQAIVHTFAAGGTMSIMLSCCCLLEFEKDNG
jgi:hypothetical protein